MGTINNKTLLYIFGGSMTLFGTAIAFYYIGKHTVTKHVKKVGTLNIVKGKKEVREMYLSIPDQTILNDMESKEYAVFDTKIIYDNDEIGKA